MTRILMLLAGLLAPGRAPVPQPAGPPPASAQTTGEAAAGRAGSGPDDPAPQTRRRRILRRVTVAGTVVVAILVFRKAMAFLAVTALSAALHLVGLNVHLPSVTFAWPWQQTSSASSGSGARTISLGPWVLQKIEGISKPALGKASFDFYFTHKVTRNIGPWPCWYASTFYAVAHASATVDLNPGPSWWAPATGHYRLQVLSRPADGHPGQVTVTMTLPLPQLPQSAHDVAIDNIPSKPVDTQHSWTYPGLACGVVLKPQFPQSVLYAQAQQIAFSKAVHSAAVTRPLIATAKSQAGRTIQDNFVQPTVNAFGYTLTRFQLQWANSA